MSPGSMPVSRPRRPSPYSAYELCGSSIPTRPYAQRTRPEQSKPVEGDSPPHRYGTPTASTAKDTARSALVGGGGAGQRSLGKTYVVGLPFPVAAVPGNPSAATRATARANRGTRLRREVGIERS